MSAELSRLAARISAQERLTTILHARIEELSQDMEASFRQAADYQLQTERKIDARFDKVDTRFAEVNARFDKVDANMAAMEQRILDTFKQVLVMIDSRLPPQTT